MTSDENKLVVVIYDDDEWDVVGDVTVSEGTRSGTGLVVGAGTETSGTVSAFDMVVTDDYIYVGYGDVDAGGKAIVKTFER